MTIEDYAYTRDGETFVIGPDGYTYTDANGVIKAQRREPIPADIIVATVMDLAIAGWAAAEESPTTGPSDTG